MLILKFGAVSEMVVKEMGTEILHIPSFGAISEADEKQVSPDLHNLPGFNNRTLELLLSRKSEAHRRGIQKEEKLENLRPVKSVRRS